MFSFVFVSGRLSEGEQMRAINAGALDYVTKPVSLRVLMAKIPRWLAAGAGRAASPAESRRPLIIPRRRAGVA
ncbi:MAG: hypothetical protein JOZ99_13070 [Actinobacteria bacterium]|nr:hypothetical protein [Actinomycetota bacterium]